MKTLIARYCEGIPKKATDNFQYEKEKAIERKESTADLKLSMKTSNASPIKKPRDKAEEDIPVLPKEMISFKTTTDDENVDESNPEAEVVSMKRKVSPKRSAKDATYTKLMMRSEKKPRVDPLDIELIRDNEARYKHCKFII